MRLRYVGAGPVTFVEVGELEPGAEFTVPDSEADGYLRRDDVVDAPPEPDAAPAVKPRKTASKTTDPAAPAASEE